MAAAAKQSYFRNIETDAATARFSVEMHGLDLSLINAIKRIIQTDIPIPGFFGEDNPSIDMIANTGPLHNEIIMHRIGLVPIHFSEDEVENFNTDEYTFELDVENKGASMLNVTTEEMKVAKLDAALTKREVQRLFPPNPITKNYVLITRLRPNEKLHFKATAVVATAQEHAGFSPVSLCAFSFMEDKKRIAHLTNPTVLDKERAYLRNEYGDPTAIKFEIESECALTPKYLVSKAIEILMQKLDKVILELADADSKYVKLADTSAEAIEGAGADAGTKGSANSRMFIFTEETDTLGNFLQSYMHDHYIRDKNPTSKNKQVSYVGYLCPHPLEKVMHLTVIIDRDAKESEFVEIVLEQCRRSLSYLQDVKSQWLLSL